MKNNILLILLLFGGICYYTQYSGAIQPEYAICLDSDTHNQDSNNDESSSKEDAYLILKASFPNNEVERATSSLQINTTRLATECFQFNELNTKANTKKKIFHSLISHKLFYSNLSERGYYTIALQKLRF